MKLPAKKATEEFSIENFALSQISCDILFEAGYSVLLGRLLLNHLAHFGSKYVRDIMIAG